MAGLADPGDHPADVLDKVDAIMDLVKQNVVCPLMEGMVNPQDVLTLRPRAAYGLGLVLHLVTDTLKELSGKAKAA